MEPPKVQTPSQIQLVITWIPGTQGVTASGPIGDKILCYGLLEMAKEAIREYKPSGLIVPV